MGSHPRPPYLAPALITGLAVIAMTFVVLGCNASDNTLKGAEGEWCNGDDSDCKDELTCDDFVCTDNAPGTEECRDICDRLDECEVEQPNCHAACRNEISPWGDDQQQAFRSCFVDDKSCDELRDADDPPQMCYDELPLPEDRRDRCERFANAASACDASSSAVDELSRACRRLARTRDEGDWAATEPCEDTLNNGCDDQLSCFQDVFDPQPPVMEGATDDDLDNSDDDLDDPDDAAMVDDAG